MEIGGYSTPYHKVSMDVIGKVIYMHATHFWNILQFFFDLQFGNITNEPCLEEQEHNKSLDFVENSQTEKICNTSEAAVSIFIIGITLFNRKSCYYISSIL